LAGRLEHPHLAAVGERLECHTVAFLRARVEQRDVGCMDGHVLVDDAALDALHRVRPRVPLDAVHALDDEVIVIDAAQYRAALTLVAPGDHDDFVALANTLHDVFLESSEL
jgi:hypothetical protein